MDDVQTTPLFRRSSSSNQNKLSEDFACPAKCGRYLLAKHRSYVKAGLGEYFDDGKGNVGLRLGRCPCGVLVCVRCKGAERDEAKVASHECPEAVQPVLL